MNSKLIRNFVTVSIFAACILSAGAQEAPPAVPEHLTESPKTEFMTPQSTVNMMRLAVVKKDAAGFKECFYNGDADAEKFIEAFGDLTIAMRSLTSLAAEKFKGDADIEKYAKTAAQVADAMEFSKIEIAGDTAKGPSAKDATKTVYFKKVDGKWKFDSIKTIPLNDATKKMGQEMPAKTKVFKQVTSELEAGKFKTPKEMWDRIGELHEAGAKAGK